MIFYSSNKTRGNVDNNLLLSFNWNKPWRLGEDLKIDRHVLRADNGFKDRISFHKSRDFLFYNAAAGVFDPGMSSECKLCKSEWMMDKAAGA